MRYAVSQEHLAHYLDESTFRFNRRSSDGRGLLFYRLLQQAGLTLRWLPRGAKGVEVDRGPSSEVFDLTFTQLLPGGPLDRRDRVVEGLATKGPRAGGCIEQE